MVASPNSTSCCLIFYIFTIIIILYVFLLFQGKK
nr:MAG TPA: hypothetical protein [Caudoviricetes sp.]